MIDRRYFMILGSATLSGLAPRLANATAMSRITAYAFTFKGLVVLGVPSNDFGGQEPGGVTDIHATAQGEYHVTFPITEKVTVKGRDAHPFYRWAAAERPLEAPRWNFHKYLTGRDGYLKAGFTSAIEPTDPRVIAAIETELAAE